MINATHGAAVAAAVTNATVNAMGASYPLAAPAKVPSDAELQAFRRGLLPDSMPWSERSAPLGPRAGESMASRGKPRGVIHAGKITDQLVARA